MFVVWFWALGSGGTCIFGSGGCRQHVLWAMRGRQTFFWRGGDLPKPCFRVLGLRRSPRAFCAAGLSSFGLSQRVTFNVWGLAGRAGDVFAQFGGSNAKRHCYVGCVCLAIAFIATMQLPISDRSKPDRGRSNLLPTSWPV